MIHPGSGHWRHRRGLRYLVLASLRESPKNGVEIIRSLEAMSMGFWRPSPGSIYPLLATMVEEGLIRKREDGKYELTEEGRGHLGIVAESRPSTPEEMLREMEIYVEYFQDLKVTEPVKLEGLKERIRSLGEKLLKVGS